MAPAYTDLPADSAELQTLHGYALYGPPREAGGGPPPLRPRFSLASEIDLAEFVLDVPPPWPLAAPPKPSPRRFGDPFPPNSVLFALFLVPLITGVAVWALGRFPL